MAKQIDDQIMSDIGSQQKLFLLEDKEGNTQVNLNARFHLGGLWCRSQVPAGETWWVYRDGQPYGQWKSGPQVLWNGYWHKWRALRINTRVVHLHFAFAGRVKGPRQAQETYGTAGVDLGCNVKAKLELPCKIANIERFLDYENPLSVFGASLKNMVIELIRELPYDQFGSWATTLREQVWNNLKSLDGRYNMVKLIGMEVEEVYITSVEPDALIDRNRTATYQLIERLRQELIQARANKERHEVEARDYEEQGRILDIAPSLLALRNDPMAQQLIASDASLREIMMAAGLNPSTILHPIRDPQFPLSGPATPGPYLNPPRSAGQLPYSEAASNPPGIVSGALQWMGGQGSPFSAPSMPSLPSSAQQTSIDPARQEQELAAIRSAGFLSAGRGQFSPTFDSNGHPIAGSTEWILEVYIQRINGHITVVFHCPAGYPTEPPRIQVRLPNDRSFRDRMPNVTGRWSKQNMLVEIVQEIDNTTL